jgi:hypothetical protein
VLRERDTEVVKSIGVIRDASGRCAGAIFELENGEEWPARSLWRKGGFWIPMSWERHGPTMSAYDEFAPFPLADGTEGFGVAEHGFVRKLS